MQGRPGPGPRTVCLDATAQATSTGSGVSTGSSLTDGGAIAKARVSVVVPCFNYGRYLDACLRSALVQDVDVEVILIDDASTDGSAAVADRLARRYQRVRLVQHDLNRGHIATYNEGLRLATGEYTVLLSADDLLAPGALARAIELFEAKPGVGLVYGRPVYFSDHTVPAQVPSGSGSWQIWPGQEWVEACCRMGRVCIVSPEVVVRTALQRELGGYRSDLPHSGDHEMWLRFATCSDVGYLDAPQAFHRVHSANMSSTDFASPLVDAQARLAAFEAALLDRAQPMVNAAALYQLARRGVATEVLWHVCRMYDRGGIADFPAEALVAFAAAVWPASVRCRRLALRRRMGPALSARIAPLFMPDVIRHRVATRRRQYGRLWWRHLG